MSLNYSELCIEELQGKSFNRILSIDYWSVAPHFETSLEICVRMLQLRKSVKYCFWGNIVPLSECHIHNHRVLNAQNFLHFNYPDLDFEYLDSLDSSLTLPKFPIFTHIEQLKSYSWNALPAGISAASTVVDICKSSSPDFRDNKIRNLVLSALSSFIIAYKLTLKEISLSLPDALILFNGRYPSYAGSRYAAIQSGLSIFYHERGSVNDRFLLTKDMPHAVSEMNLRLKHSGKQLLESIISNTSSHDIYRHQWFENRIKIEPSDLDNAYKRVLGYTSQAKKKSLRIL